MVGCTPILKPGDSFEYHSGTDLDMTQGYMEGSFQMVVLGAHPSFYWNNKEISIWQAVFTPFTDVDAIIIGLLTNSQHPACGRPAVAAAGRVLVLAQLSPCVDVAKGGLDAGAMHADVNDRASRRFDAKVAPFKLIGDDRQPPLTAYNNAKDDESESDWS